MLDDIIEAIESNKKLNSLNSFLRGRILNISLVLISQSYFKLPKSIRPNTTLYFIIKIPEQKRTSANGIE